MDPDIKEGKRRQRDLEAAKAAFFSAGGVVREIPRGKSAFGPTESADGHHNRLRIERDKLAAAVREQAELGKTAGETAKALKLLVKRVKLIAQENGFKFHRTN